MAKHREYPAARAALPDQLDRALQQDQLVLWVQRDREYPVNQVHPALLSDRVRRLIQRFRVIPPPRMLLGYLSARALLSPPEFRHFRSYQEVLDAQVTQPAQFVPEFQGHLG